MTGGPIVTRLNRAMLVTVLDWLIVRSVSYETFSSGYKNKSE